jgi:hypothetical protein
MVNPIKLGYITGFDLVFSVYQEDGSGIGLAFQPLPELAEGYYGANPLVALEAGNEVVAYSLDYLAWEGSNLVILNFDNLAWEGNVLSYEGQWLITYDSQSYDNLVDVGAVVGAQEYTAPSDWYDLLSASITTVSGSVGSIGAISNINDSGLDANGNPRVIKEGQIGFVEEFMKGI